MSGLLEEVRNARRLPPPAVAREIRRAAGVTQSQLAAELGVHRASVARWELGTRLPQGARRAAYITLLDGLREVVLSA